MGSPPGTAIGLTISMAAFAVVGALIASRQPRQPIAWLFLIVALGANLASAAGIYGQHLLASSNTPASAIYLVWLGSWLFGVAILLNIFVLLLIPTGQLASQRWRPLFWLAAVSVGIFAWGTAVLPGPIPDTDIQNPMGLEWMSQVESQLRIAVDVALFTLLIGSIVQLVQRVRRATGTERQQFKWFAYGAVLVIIVNFGVNPLFQGDPVLQDLPFSMGIGILPIVTGLAILRYRLYDIDRIISRTVSYALVVGLLAAVFFGLVTALAWLLSPERPLVLAASTLAVFALFNPLRKRIQTAVDRRFNRSRYDAERVMESFAESLRNRIDPEDFLDGWVGIVSQTMQPRSTSVWVRE